MKEKNTSKKTAWTYSPRFNRKRIARDLTNLEQKLGATLYALSKSKEKAENVLNALELMDDEIRKCKGKNDVSTPKESARELISLFDKFLDAVQGQIEAEILLSYCSSGTCP